MSSNSVDGIYNEANITHNSTKQIIKDHKHEEIHFIKSLMDAFDTGLPCQSSLLNIFYTTGYIIKNSETKVLVQYCKVILPMANCLNFQV